MPHAFFIIVCGYCVRKFQPAVRLGYYGMPTERGGSRSDPRFWNIPRSRLSVPRDVSGALTVTARPAVGETAMPATLSEQIGDRRRGEAWSDGPRGRC
jgi:hypothetical protein